MEKIIYQFLVHYFSNKESTAFIEVDSPVIYSMKTKTLESYISASIIML